MSDKPKILVDLYRLSEDERIEWIGEKTMRDGTAVFAVDHDRIEKGKADRYMRKLRECFPRIREVRREEDTPVYNVTTVYVAKTDG